MSSDVREREVARLLADRYEVVRFIGKGGFASVYQVVNLRLRRVEALKVLHMDHTEEPDFARRFEQEARVAASLDHPNIVKIFDYGHQEDLFWFSMQLIAGPSLSRELRQKGKMAEEAAARLGIAVLDALAYSHSRNVIHRDIKPENILLDPGGRPYLMDFGIAKSAESAVRTRTGMVMGSPAYIAPEQLSSGRVDGRADLYALGVSLYQMLTCAFPFTDDDPFRMVMKRLTMAPEPLSQRRPDVSSTLETIVMRAIEREPAHRFADASEMREALETFLSGSPLPARLAAAVPGDATAGTAVLSSGLAVGAAVPSGQVSLPEVSPGPDSLPTVRTAPPQPGARTARPRRGAIAIAALLVLGVAGAVLFLSRSGRTQVPPPATDPPSAEAAAPETQPTLPASLASSPEVTPAPVAPSPVAQSRGADPSLRRDSPPVVVRQAEPRAAPTPDRRPVTPPETETEVALEISEDVARQYADKPVGISVLVGEDGSVKRARVISPLCPECDLAALAAVRRYRFKPARDRQGDPVEGQVALTVIINPQSP